MFISGYWAKAFINSVEKEGCDIEDGLETVKVLASWVRSLPGEITGRSAAAKLERLIRGGMAGAPLSPAREIALRFVILAVRKNALRHIDQVIEEIKKLLDKQNGVITVTLESAFPVEDDSVARIKAALEKSAGINRVNFVKRINPELVGGCMLKIGDKIMDASIRSQLQKLEMYLAGNGGSQWQITAS